MRGDTQSPEPGAIVIPRGRLDATIVLPLGAEAGPYEVRLVDDNGQGRLTAVALDEAMRRLDETWDGLFPYNASPRDVTPVEPTGRDSWRHRLRAILGS